MIVLFFSDEYVASLIDRECNSKSKFEKYDNKPYQSKPDVNRVFLTNTIQNVESHNRREEIDDCWRQHSTLKRARLPPPPTSTSSSSRVVTRHSSQNIEISHKAEAERQFWASRKVNNFTKNSDIIIEDTSGDNKDRVLEGSVDSSSSTSDISEDDANSPNRGSKRHRRIKSKSKKKKKNKKKGKEKTKDKSKEKDN